MIGVDLETLVEWTGGRRIGGEPGTVCSGVSIDSRTLAPGNLFVAVRGERFDGHDFAAAAVDAGCAALLVERPLEIDAPQLVVAGTRPAFGAIGARWRARFDIPVIAVTGSNGKTTVKECLAAILRQRHPALATRGNLNNDLGVPLMLCELAAEHRAAVFELASNHPGEIADLARLVAPGVAVITNADAAHLEGFGSLAAVAAGNAEILAGLASDGVLVLPADCEWTAEWRRQAGDRAVLTFAAEPGADVVARAADGGSIELAVGGESLVAPFALAGEHNRRNAAAAAAAAHAAGFDAAAIAAGLAAVRPVPGRLVARRGRAGARVLDDSYNANPGSFAAALGVLSAAAGRRWAVVGEMAELGGDAAGAHLRLGRELRAHGVERVWAFGPSAARVREGFGAGAEVVDDLAGLADELAAGLAADVHLLVKGSRSNALERVVERLVVDAAAPGAHAGEGG